MNIYLLILDLFNWLKSFWTTAPETISVDYAGVNVRVKNSGTCLVLKSATGTVSVTFPTGQVLKMAPGMKVRVSKFSNFIVSSTANPDTITFDVGDFDESLAPNVSNSFNLAPLWYANTQIFPNSGAQNIFEWFNGPFVPNPTMGLAILRVTNGGGGCSLTVQGLFNGTVLPIAEYPNFVFDSNRNPVAGNNITAVGTYYVDVRNMNGLVFTNSGISNVTASWVVSPQPPIFE